MPTTSEIYAQLGTSIAADATTKQDAIAEAMLQRDRANKFERDFEAYRIAHPAGPVVDPPDVPTVPPVVPPGPMTTKQVPDVGEAFNLTVPGRTIANLKMLDGKGTAFKINADNVTLQNVEIGKVGQYLVEIENGKGIRLNVRINGGSMWQSHIRTLRPTCEVTLDDCRLIDTFAKDKALLRGPGTWTINGGWFEGAVIGEANALNKGDGGREVLVTTIKLGVSLDKNATYVYHCQNADETRAAVMKTARTTSDPIELAKVFRSVAILWTNDERKRTVKCADYCPDSQFAVNIKERAASLAEWGKSTWKNGAQIRSPFSLETNKTCTFDGTINATVKDKFFAGVATQYPEPGTFKNGVMTDPGWLLPYDKARSSPTLAGNGDTINAPGGWGVSEAVLLQVMRGWFMFNGVKRVFS